MRNEMKNKLGLTLLVPVLMVLSGSMSACATGGSGTTSWKTN